MIWTAIAMLAFGLLYLCQKIGEIQDQMEDLAKRVYEIDLDEDERAEYLK